MMRHSGASIDRATQLRSMEEIRKRGRWASSSSVLRYEREAHLASQWTALSASQRSLFQAYDDLRVDVIVRGASAPAPGVLTRV